MTIDDLNVLKAVSETKNLIVSARDLFKTESSLSKTIKRLEAELGVKLFILEHNRMALTKEGQKAADIATDIIAKAEELYCLGEDNKKRIKILSTDVEFLQIVEEMLSNNELFREYEIEEHYSDPLNIKRMYELDRCDIALTLSGIKTMKRSFTIDFDWSPVIVARKGLIKNGVKAYRLKI
ncbi:MAG: LysR family transcriptional regulator [Firmicutes bacterium]|nr:LysR family transcriptional regulator [Bacillota bacterium]